jgi:hypothetical protein
MNLLTDVNLARFTVITSFVTTIAEDVTTVKNLAVKGTTIIVPTLMLVTINTIAVGTSVNWCAFSSCGE